MRRLLMLLLVLGALVPVGIVVAGDSSDPGQPEWADAQGNVKKDKVPAEFGVSGPDGRPVVCANGKELKVKKEKLLGPPPHPSRHATASDQEYVWRCGTGANPHQNARLVPESQDPLQQDNGERPRSQGRGRPPNAASRAVTLRPCSGSSCSCSWC